MDEPSAVAVVAEHVAGAYGFTMKTAVNEFLHRVLPLRDPDQPRFWCVVVVRCTPGGLPDRSQLPWVGQRGLRREELSEAMEAIRSDLSAWLAQPEQTALREWVLVPGIAAAPLNPSRTAVTIKPRSAAAVSGRITCRTTFGSRRTST